MMDVKRIRISIHTALAGCDPTFQAQSNMYQISIHTALAGCDGYNITIKLVSLKFQSTQPSQAVTLTFVNPQRKVAVFQSTQPSQAVTAIIPNKNHILTDIIIYNAYIFN